MRAPPGDRAGIQRHHRAEGGGGVLPLAQRQRGLAQQEVGEHELRVVPDRVTGQGGGALVVAPVHGLGRVPVQLEGGIVPEPLAEGPPGPGEGPEGHPQHRPPPPRTRASHA
jgi:hypothetical protein